MARHTYCNPQFQVKATIIQLSRENVGVNESNEARICGGCDKMSLYAQLMFFSICEGIFAFLRTVGFKKSSPPARGVTSIKFKNRWLQKFAIPARGITPIKFSFRRSRRVVEVRNSTILSF